MSIDAIMLNHVSLQNGGGGNCVSFLAIVNKMFKNINCTYIHIIHNHSRPREQCFLNLLKFTKIIKCEIWECFGRGWNAAALDLEILCT